MKYFEKYYPLLVAVLLVLIAYKLNNWRNFNLFQKSILDIDITIGAVIFGFLLTMLGILSQTNNQVLEFLKKHDRYKDFIGYNKEAVALSSVTAVYSLAILIILEVNQDCSLSFVLEAFWAGLNISMLLATYRFVSLFYLLISKK